MHCSLCTVESPRVPWYAVLGGILGWVVLYRWHANEVISYALNGVHYVIAYATCASLIIVDSSKPSKTHFRQISPTGNPGFCCPCLKLLLVYSINSGLKYPPPPPPTHTHTHAHTHTRTHTHKHAAPTPTTISEPIAADMHHP